MILKESCGEDVARLYFEFSRLIDEELNKKYDHSKFGGVLGTNKKSKSLF